MFDEFKNNMSKIKQSLSYIPSGVGTGWKLCVDEVDEFCKIPVKASFDRMGILLEKESIGVGF